MRHPDVAGLTRRLHASRSKGYTNDDPLYSQVCFYVNGNHSGFVVCDRPLDPILFYDRCLLSPLSLSDYTTRV